jgi:hypothetical protein
MVNDQPPENYVFIQDPQPDPLAKLPALAQRLGVEPRIDAVVQALEERDAR